MKLYIFLILLIAVIISDYFIYQSLSAPKDCYTPDRYIINIPASENVACYLPKEKYFVFCNYTPTFWDKLALNPVVACSNIEAPDIYSNNSGIGINLTANAIGKYINVT